jgi:hypothetical protein
MVTSVLGHLHAAGIPASAAGDFNLPVGAVDEVILGFSLQAS